MATICLTEIKRDVGITVFFIARKCSFFRRLSSDQVCIDSSPLHQLLMSAKLPMKKQNKLVSPREKLKRLLSLPLPSCIIWVTLQMLIVKLTSWILPASSTAIRSACLIVLSRWAITSTVRPRGQRTGRLLAILPIKPLCNLLPFWLQWLHWNTRNAEAWTVWSLCACTNGRSEATYMASIQPHTHLWTLGQWRLGRLSPTRHRGR